MVIWGLIEEYATTRVTEAKEGKTDRMRKYRQQIKKDILQVLEEMIERG